MYDQKLMNYAVKKLAYKHLQDNAAVDGDILVRESRWSLQAHYTCYEDKNYFIVFIDHEITCCRARTLQALNEYFKTFLAFFLSFFKQFFGNLSYFCFVLFLSIFFLACNIFSFLAVFYMKFSKQNVLVLDCLWYGMTNAVLLCFGLYWIFFFMLYSK